ncbi:MAG: hypothetical protein K5851_01175, partial [Lachnospiraceae bacterium]|nr:hypothetical protein [Lachnospiraceae bacterium]
MNNKSFDSHRIAEGYAKRPWLHKGIIERFRKCMGIGMRKRVVVLNCVLCAVLLSACSFEEKNSQQSSDSSSENYTY